ncbi:MAG TPA: hypothetical protein VF677_15240 [Flavobacterium sp.]|jgi:hypothetical protein
MDMGRFQNNFSSLILILFLTSCQSNSEKALSVAYGSFDYQVDDLRLDNLAFNGPIILKKDDRNFPPRVNHTLYGWYNVIKTDTIWLYVEVDTTFTKEPSVSFSNNFFEFVEKNKTGLKTE